MKTLQILKTISLFGTGFFSVALFGSVVRLSQTMLPIALVFSVAGLITFAILWLREGFSWQITGSRALILLGLVTAIAGGIAAWL